MISDQENQHHYHLGVQEKTTLQDHTEWDNHDAREKKRILK